MAQDREIGYRRTEVGTVGWDDELDAVLLRWHGFATSRSFREHMRLCIDLLEAVGANKMYADARDQGAIGEEDKLWSITEWASQADAAGLEYLVIVYPESVIAKMSVDTVIEQVEDDIERRITDDVAGGRAWLKERPTTATGVTTSQLNGLNRDVEPAPDTDGETDSMGRPDAVASTAEPDTDPESSVDSTVDDTSTSPQGSETETEVTNGGQVRRDARSATTTRNSVQPNVASTSQMNTTATTSDVSSEEPPDPPTVALVGGIISLIGTGTLLVGIGRIPELVSSGLINAVLLVGGSVLLGMALGWVGAKTAA